MKPMCMVFRHQRPFETFELQESCQRCFQNQFPWIQRTGPVVDQFQFTPDDEFWFWLTPCKVTAKTAIAVKDLSIVEQCDGN